MSELNYFLLTIVTENQKQKNKTERLAELLQSELGEGWEILNIDKYDKFQNSYKIELKGSATAKQQPELNHLAIRLTDSLVSPWLIYFDKHESSIELIYNKETHSRIRKIEFDSIKWGQLIVTK